MKIKPFLLAGIIFSLVALTAYGVAANDTDITFHDKPNPIIRQTITLWDAENIPSRTVWNDSNPTGDPEDFMPNMISVPPADGTEIKGAVMINPGGAFAYRSPAEGLPVAEELSRLGYQCFVVNYRLRPYSQEEAALDLARGIRYVRAHAADYGIDPNDIATIGFSAGGILSGELALHFQGAVSGTVLDPDYIPDTLDETSADVAAVGLMYSFYGRLSVASTDAEALKNADLPPTYVLYGSNEVFRNQIENQVDLLEEIGAPVEHHILEGYSHGFGARGNWFEDFDRFLTEIYAGNSAPDTELLRADEPVIEDGNLRYSIAANGDISGINIITALYQNKALADVRVNQLNGTFALKPGTEYMMKVFAWTKDSMSPVTDSKAFYHLVSDVPQGEMQEMLNNVLKGKDGNIHYTYYLPANYDPDKSYPMLMTLPGWSSKFNTIETTPLTENSYASGNAKAWTEALGDMIVVSPSLTDWGDKSARQTIELTEYFIDNFAVDKSQIYAAGFSAGGETLSRAIDMRPDLFAAYLHSASQWDGGYDNAAKYHIPIYICMAEHDEYYGAGKARDAYENLKAAYRAAGISDTDIEKLLVLDIKEDSYFSGAFAGNYHGGGWLFASDADIIGWLTSK